VTPLQPMIQLSVLVYRVAFMILIFNFSNTAKKKEKKRKNDFIYISSSYSRSYANRTSTRIALEPDSRWNPNPTYTSPHQLIYILYTSGKKEGIFVYYNLYYICSTNYSKQKYPLFFLMIYIRARRRSAVSRTHEVILARCSLQLRIERKKKCGIKSRIRLLRN